jgi:hypothetical protein
MLQKKIQKKPWKKKLPMPDEAMIDVSNISAIIDSSLDDIGNRRSPLVHIRHSVIFDLTVSLDGKRKVAEQWPE